MVIECGRCEKDWIIGVSGVCNEDKGVCECPDGYSGVDDWSIEKTCQVNENLATGIHVVGFIVSSIALVIVLRKLFVISKEIRILKNKGDVTSDTKTVPRKQQRAIHFKYQCKQAVLFQISGIVCTIAYFLQFIVAEKKQTLENQENFSQRLFLALSVAFMSPSPAFIGIAWYEALPPPRRFGHLLDYTALVMKYPDFVPNLCYTFILSCVTSCFLFFFVIPSYVGSMNVAFYYMYVYFGLVCIVFALMLVIYFNSLVKVYLQALESQKRRLAASQGADELTEKEVEKLEKVVKHLRYFKCATLTHVFSVLVYLNFLLSIEFTYQYIFLNIFGILTPMILEVIAVVII